MKFAFVVAALAALPATATLAQDGDAEAGKDLFKRCSSCHVIANGDEVIDGRGKTGPNLYGIAGRQAGTVEGFNYGDSLVAAGEAGLEWNEEDFATYTADPRKFLREYLDDSKARSKMSFRLKDGASDLWAYLVSVGPEAE